MQTGQLTHSLSSMSWAFLWLLSFAAGLPGSPSMSSNQIFLTTQYPSRPDTQTFFSTPSRPQVKTSTRQALAVSDWVTRQGNDRTWVRKKPSIWWFDQRLWGLAGHIEANARNVRRDEDKRGRPRSKYHVNGFTTCQGNIHLWQARIRRTSFRQRGPS